MEEGVVNEVRKVGRSIKFCHVSGYKAHRLVADMAGNTGNIAYTQLCGPNIYV